MTAFTLPFFKMWGRHTNRQKEREREQSTRVKKHFIVPYFSGLLGGVFLYKYKMEEMVVVQAFPTCSSFCMESIFLPFSPQFGLTNSLHCHLGPSVGPYMLSPDTYFHLPASLFPSHPYQCRCQVQQVGVNGAEARA